MEKMKRLLSGFLALVMVLGMMPGVSIVAGAEELETQPETMAVETTEAVQIPEETEPVQTEPAETVPAETEAEEVIPAQTEEEETVPQETVSQETVPQETVEETLPEETVPAETEEELAASADAADASYEEIIPVEELVVTAEKELAYYTATKSEQVKLTCKVNPDNASETTITWVLVQDEVEYRDDDADGIIEGDGVEFDTETCLLYATDLASPDAIVAELYTESVYTADDEYQDPEDREEEAANPVCSDPVKVTFVSYRMEINLLPLAEVNRFEEEDTQYDYTQFCRVKSGTSMELSVKFMRGLRPGETAAQDRDYMTQCLSKPDIEWSAQLVAGGSGGETRSVHDEADQYVYLGVGSDTTKVNVKAKAVTRTYIVRLTAKDLDTGLEHSVFVVVYPKPYKVLVDADESLEYVAVKPEEGLIIYDLNRMPKEEDEEEVPPILLKARVYPKEYSNDYPEGYDELYPDAASYKLNWELSDNIISLEDPDEEDEKNNEMLLTVDPYKGSTIITITSEEDPDLEATVKVRRIRLMDPARLHISDESNKILEMIAGETKTFTAIDTKDREILDEDVVEWSLPREEDHPYASLDKDGTLKVKDIAVGKEIVLRCTITDHPDDNAYIEHRVVVRPKATKVEIFPGDLPGNYDSDMICNGETLFVKTNDGTVDGPDPFAMDFAVYPLNTGVTALDIEVGGAKNEVKWTSSDENIAEINAKNEIVWKKHDGVVTITAKATDGSGKKASVKLNFCKQADGVDIILPGTVDYVRSGTNMPLDVKIYPASVDEKIDKEDMLWEIVECDLCGEDVQCAKISSSGKVTAKTVYENHEIKVRATCQDGSEEYGEMDLTVKPKQDGILVLKEGSEYVTKTTQMVDVEDSIQLNAYNLDGSNPGYVTWKSSSKNIDVDPYGCVTVLRPGTATITATAGDGRKATVTVKGVRMAYEVIISQKDDQTDLASGKSMTLTATVLDDEDEPATIKKVQWFIEDELGNLTDSCAHATIKNGKLTAVKDYEGAPETVRVVAMATDGSEVEGDYYVTVYPVAKGVRIDLDAFERTRTTCLYQLGSSPAALTLSATVYPETASQAYTWKSSNKSIAEFDPDDPDTLIVKKAGTVTITATAADGSNVKSSFKLQIVPAADDITFSNTNFVSNNRLVIAGGKKITLKPTLWDADGKKISGRSLSWEIQDVEYDDDNGLAYASLSEKGVLDTRKVSEPKYVKIIVKTVEPSDSATWDVLEHEIIVEIWPATTDVSIRYNGQPLREVYMSAPAAGSVKTLDLDALSYCTGSVEKAAQAWDWKSSKTKVATVDENGLVTALKAGTVTITATAKDGTGKYDTIKVIISE